MRRAVHCLNLKAYGKYVQYSTAAQVKSVNDVQRLYYTNPTSPGSVFFLPPGTRLFGKLAAFVRAQMTSRGFDEVISPQLYKKELWETSGHWEHYKDDMFGVTDGHESLEPEYSLKPMNCPGHCLIFKSQERSFRDLPVRYAEFAPLHRNEAAGALTGLTRVRRFHQDDGHIFCRPDQVQQEIHDSIRLVDTVYKVFGLSYEMILSTRPDEFIGDLELWNQAESGLKNAIQNAMQTSRQNAEQNADHEPREVTINEGDGAFYGPKIDFIVTDSVGNRHQAATIQLDFQLPRNFDLKYDDETGTGVPVMVHRAIFGSFERFMALLIDHYGGKWPLWLNPRQVIVLPLSDAHAEYADAISRRLGGLDIDVAKPVPSHVEKYDVEVFKQSEPLGGRLKRAAELSPSYIVVVGDREVQSGTLSVRERGSKASKTMGYDEFTQLLRDRVDSFT